MLAKRVFYAPPGALAEHFDSSRMNWKVRFHSHGSSLMIDANTQRQLSGTLFFEPQTKSMRQLAPPKTRRAPQRSMKKMSGADSQADNQTNRQTVEASDEKHQKMRKL